MTVPVQPAPVPPAPAAAPPSPSPEVPQSAPPELAQPEQGGDVWPPDPATMLQMMMFARFSTLDEPAGDQTVQGADQAGPPAGTPPPQPQAQTQPQG